VRVHKVALCHGKFPRKGRDLISLFMAVYHDFIHTQPVHSRAVSFRAEKTIVRQGTHNSPLSCTSGDQASTTAAIMIWFLWLFQALIRPVWCEEAPPVASFATAKSILGMMAGGAIHSRSTQIPSGRNLKDAARSSFFVVTDTLLSDALAKGETSVAGATKRRMSVAFTVASDGKPGDALQARDDYIRKELLPALGSLLARSIRVCLDSFAAPRGTWFGAVSVSQRGTPLRAPDVRHRRCVAFYSIVPTFPAVGVQQDLLLTQQCCQNIPISSGSLQWIRAVSAQ
jgi:hypothetical protein